MDQGAGIMAGMLFIILIIFFIFAIILGVYVITSIIYKKILEKDGRNGWLGFVPIYRDYLLIEMGEMNWYWILAMYGPTLVGMVAGVIPFIGSLITMALTILAAVAKINVYYNLSKKFKTEDWYIVLLALVPIVGLGILAFSSRYEYHKEEEVKPDGFFGDLGFITKDEPEKEEPKKEETTSATKVTEEEIKETKKEEVKEANVSETKKKPNNKKKKEDK